MICDCLSAEIEHASLHFTSLTHGGLSLTILRRCFTSRMSYHILHSTIYTCGSGCSCRSIRKRKDRLPSTEWRLWRLSWRAACSRADISRATSSPRRKHTHTCPCCSTQNRSRLMNNTLVPARFPMFDMSVVHPGAPRHPHRPVRGVTSAKTALQYTALRMRSRLRNTISTPVCRACRETTSR